ncbi:TonB-dependent siderophore receptor [Pantanalinema sp. GBBB05]|uniref:TonB-dependent siderophore receptor n=1 Tax=Pantanalinema sp. GBBB05 TaxID=2604139 RepID=UPI001E0230CA|nr:TonB-dependent siderophore receptor [Pantanalinema sp. GBBB05]
MKRYQLATAVGLAGTIALCASGISDAQEERLSNQPAQGIQLTEREQPRTQAADLLAQTEPAAIVQVTGVRVNSTEGGIQIILETDQDIILQPEATRREAKTFIAEIANAVLALPDRQEFQLTAPAPGIQSVTVTQSGNNRLEIRVTGETEFPTVVVQSQLSPTATLPEDAEAAEEEVIVTGDRPSQYRVPNASTATGTDTPILETPFSVQVVPQEVLRDQQAIRLEDALTNISGVSSTGTNGGREAAFSIRGFGNQVSSGAPVLRDGYRLYGNFQGIPELANLQQIEVLKGPASILYGQIEPGGVINLVSKQPLAEPFREAEFQLGNRELLRPRLDVTGPLTDNGDLLYRLNLLFQHEKPFRDFDSDTNRLLLAPALTWKIGDRTDITFNLEYIRQQSAADFGLTRYGDGVAPVSREFVANHPDDSVTTNYLSTGYNFEHRFSDDWKIRNSFRYISYDYNYNVIALPFRVIGDNIIRFYADQDGTDRSYSLFTNVVGKFSTGSVRHTLTAGIDLNHSDSRITTFFGNPTPLNIFNPNYDLIPKPDRADLPPFGDNRTTANRLGIYLQDQIYLLDNLILVAGLRYDTVTQKVTNIATAFTDESESEQTNDALTPRVGLLYRPIPELTLFANYSQSFKPSTALTASGSVLEPEEGEGFEVGVKTELFDQRLLATLTYFNITKKNVGATDPDNPLFSIAVGEQKSQGIELDIAGEILPGWKIITSYAYIDANVTEDTDETVIDNEFFGIPKHKASLWTTYEIQQGSLKGLGFGAGFEYVSNRYGDLANSFQVGDYLIGNAAIFYRRDNYRFAVNIRNIGNTNYIRSVTGSDSGIQPGEPLTVIGSFSLQF